MTNGEGATEHRLVLGPGGSGKTFLLSEWRSQYPGPSALVTGRPARAANKDDLRRALADEPDLLVFDDFQWATQECLETVISLATSSALTLWASRRPYPNTAGLMTLSDICTETTPAVRLSLLDVDEVGVRLALATQRPASGDLVESIFSLTLGAAGLVGDVLDQGDLALIGEEEYSPGAGLIDQVVARVRRSGPEAAELANFLAFDSQIEMSNAVRALPDYLDAGVAERSLRASGLVSEDGTLAPLVVDCLSADMTVADRVAIRSSLASSLESLDPVVSAKYVDDSAGDAPGVLLAAAQELASSSESEALSCLSRIDPNDCSSTQLRSLVQLSMRLSHVGLDRALQTGLDSYPDDFTDLAIARQLKLLRWPLAASERAVGEPAKALLNLAAALTGKISEFAEGNPIGTQGLTRAAVTAINGDVSGAFSMLTGLADDFRAIDGPEVTLGLTPHLLGALVGLLVGDSEGAGLLLDEAIEAGVGGPGETEAAKSLRAFTSLRQADYSAAVEFISGASPSVDYRLRLLSAALVAGLARRSGDMARMREAWAEADAVLSRPTASWLLTEILGELLLVGVKLGHERRVGEILGELEAQVSSQAAASPGAVSVAWLRFQLAVQRSDADDARVEAELLAMVSPSDDRSIERIEAAQLWVQSMTGSASEADLLRVASELGRLGDRWEASRLLGSAALDLEDPDGSRRLLEAARSLSADLEAVERGDGLVALGLSEREAEVARLVADGNTYKEIGAQLYISPKTVEHHVARAKQKLGAGSRAEFRSIVAQSS